MDRMNVREGMQVRSSDGEKLGKIVRCDEDAFVIEKGFFFPKDTIAGYHQIARIEGDELVLTIPAAALHEGASGRVGEQRELGAEREGELRPHDERREVGTAGLGVSEQMRIPVAEEELVAEKRDRQAGEVRVHKEVVTEHRQIDVPVTREEVNVERVPVERGEARGDEARFQEGTISVPVREEEVEIRKRPVVKEEVRVGKTIRQEERRAEADVRREEVEVEKEGDLERRGATRTPGIRDPEE
jgi:uncharacterized protein (TIGR02271 family)